MALGSAERCSICRELGGGPSSVAELAAAGFGTTRLAHSAGGAILLAVGPLVEGHLLVVPSEHLCSARELSPPAIEALDILVARAIGAVTGCYGPAAVFEHGPSDRRCPAGQCLEHAHIHVLPLSIDLHALVRRQRGFGSAATLPSLSALASQPPAPYLLVRDPTGTLHLHAAPDLPSQYLRMLIAAHAAGTHGWDWRADPRLAAMRSARDKLSAGLGVA